MEPLIIQESSEGPAINLNGDTGVFSFTGKSYPENVNDFYKPVFEYFEQYKKAPKDKTTLEFNWLYFNTATSKVIIKLIMSLKEQKQFEVVWKCKKTDELMIEKGEEMKEVLGVNFQIVYL